VEGLIESGRLLTLTVSQAVEVGYADGVVADRTALLAELGLTDRELVSTSPSLAEELVRIITNPVVASLLLIVGMLVLIGDLLSGGLGVGVIAGIGLLGLFFWGHMLAGLAGWEDLTLVLVGLMLIAVEVFVVPGFGVPGILGLMALLGGAFLAMIYRDFDFVTNDDLVRAAITVGLTLVIVVLGLVFVLTALSRRGAPGGLVLQARLGSGELVTNRAGGGWLRWFGGPGRDVPPEPVAEAEQSLVGAIGTALSDLRPSGVAEIDGQRVDVVTTGEYLRSGERIEVIRDERYRRVVRRHHPSV
jgi:membrane-bound serine protease (ClpP class)